MQSLGYNARMYILRLNAKQKIATLPDVKTQNHYIGKRECIIPPSAVQLTLQLNYNDESSACAFNASHCMLFLLPFLSLTMLIKLSKRVLVVAVRFCVNS